MTDFNTLHKQAEMVFYQPIEDIWSVLVDMHSYWKWNPILKDVYLSNGLLYHAPIEAKYSVFNGVLSKKGIILNVDENKELRFCFHRYHLKIVCETWRISLIPLSDFETQVSLTIGYSGWFSASAWQNDEVAIDVACDVFIHALKQMLEGS
ncbi:hypothetical protein [Marinomonas sp. 2405UD68-3]|uniref:hypothetical protein n=1 Tax=Marinomonas sp. 2405UD68-3 TaxID=3391835 RepID=UPI0039C9AA5D